MLGAAALCGGSPSAFAADTWNGGNYTWPGVNTVYVLGSGSVPVAGNNGLFVRNSTGGTISLLNDVLNVAFIRMYENGHAFSVSGTGALVLGGATDLQASSGISLQTTVVNASNEQYHFDTDIYVGGNFNANNTSLVVFANNSAPHQNNLLVFGATDARKTIAGLQTNASGTADLRLYGSGGGIINDHLADGVGQGAAGTTTLALTMLSSATWTLTGSGAYTGLTTVMGGGRLVLDNSTLNAEKISNHLVLGGTIWGAPMNGVPIWFGGGGAAVELIGSGGADSAETLSTLTVANGANQIIVTPGAVRNAVFNLGTVSRGGGGGATLDLLANGAGASFTAASADGDLGAWATLNGSDYASVSSGQIVAATYTGWGAGNNVNVSGDDSQSGATAGKLKIGAATLTLSGNNTLSDGGILFAADAGGGATISGGSLSAGNNEFIIQQHNTAHALTIESALSAAMLTKSGAGDLILSGTSSATQVNINAGSLKIGADNVLAGAATSAGVVNVDPGATLDLNGHELTVWSLRSRNAYEGVDALQYGRSAVVGNFAAGTEATLVINRSNAPATWDDAWYGDFAEGAGAVLNIVKRGAGSSRVLWGSNGDNGATNGYLNRYSQSYLYDIIAGNVSVEQGTLIIGNDLYSFGGLNVAAGAIFQAAGSGQYGFATPGFTGLTGAGNLYSGNGQAFVINMDGSAEADVWTGQLDGGTTIIFIGQGEQFVGLQTLNKTNGFLAAGRAVVVTPGLTQATGVALTSPLSVAGQGTIKVTGTSGVVAGIGGVSSNGLTFAGGTIWIAPDGSGQNITVSGMTAAANNSIAYGRALADGVAGNINQLSGNSTLLLDRGANTSLDFQLGNATSDTAKFVRFVNGTLVIKAAHGLAELGTTEKLTILGTGTGLPALTNGIINTSIVAADGQTGAGSFLTTSAVTNGVVLKEAVYETDLTAATATSVVKVIGSVALSGTDGYAAYALRNDGAIVNNSKLTLGGGVAKEQAGLIMNNASITGSGTLTAGANELVIYVSGSNEIGNKIVPAGATNDQNQGITLAGDGLLRITAPQTFAHLVQLNSGVLEIAGMTSWNNSSSFWLRGGVLQTSGNFTRTLSGVNANSFMWYDGGFAAAGAAGLTVNIYNDQRTLTWGQNGFLTDYSAMKLGSEYANGVVTLLNGVDLGLSNAGGWWGTDPADVTGRKNESGASLFRMIEVADNPDTNADHAIISGVISGTLSDYKGIQKIGDGMLFLTGNNTYTGPTSIAEGTLAIVADSGLGAAPGAAAPVTGYVNEGTVLINGGATLLAANSMTISANRNILLASGSDGSRGANITVWENSTVTFGGKLGDSVGEKGSLLVNGTNIGGQGTNAVYATGTLLLTGTSTIGGRTEVAQGTLLVDGGLTTSNVIVSAGATLGGAGDLATSSGGISLSGELDATAGIKLTLTGGKLNFLTGSTLTLDVADALTFSTVGDWLSGSGNATLNLSGISDYTISYTIFENVTTSGFTFASINGYDTQYDAVWEMNGNNYVLSFQQIPEPGTWALMLTGATLLAALRLRRKK